MLFTVLPIVIATPSFFIEQNKDFDLKISCFDNDNNFCDVTTICTITINLPNSTTTINNQNMTFNPSFYNYTINSSDLNVRGEYTVITNCVGTTSGFQTFSFGVTMDGFVREPNIALYLSLILLSLFFIFMGAITLWRGKDA